MTPTDLPTPARAIAAAATDAVAAARAADAEGFERAAARLDLLDPEQVRLVLGAVVRSLLERLHPDGVDGDDLQQVIGRCARAAHPWCPATDPAVLAVVLTGAFGVQEDDPQHVPGPQQVGRHAVLVVADLLDAGGGDLHPYLAGVWDDLAAAGNTEQP